MLIIAYFTENTQYETLANNLRQSCNQFNIPNHIKPVQNLGSWEKNTHYKAQFILDCLNQFSENLLYVDVDAVFRSYPELLQTLDCDIAYRTENFRWRANEALSGTIYLRNSRKTKELVKSWIQLNESNPAQRFDPTTWEQANMQRVVQNNPDINYYNLPPGFTYIFDHHRKMYPNEKIIIEHFQESRNVFRRKSL